MTHIHLNGAPAGWRARQSTAAPDWARISLGRLLAVALVLAALVLAACAGGGRLGYAGATTLVPLVSDLCAALEEERPDIRCAVTGGGSTKGVLDVATGAAQIGGAAREPKPGEEARVRFVPVALDALAVIGHRDLGLAALTGEELRAVFTGDVPARLAGIPRVGKAPAHGTHQAFKAAIAADGPLEADAEAGSNGELIAYVLASRGLGYVSLADAEAAIAAGEPLTILAIDGVVPSVAAIRAGRYTLVRRLHVLLPRPSGEGQGGPGAPARAFMALLESPRGRDMIRAAGFLPID